MKIALKLIGIFIIYSSLLSSCGFNALYGEKTVAGQLDAIKVNPISSVEGAELYHYLSDLLPLRKNPIYNLSVTFTHFGSPIAIQKNSDILRENVSHTVQFELRDIVTNKILTSGKFRQMTSYNTTFTPYGSYIEKEHTSKNLTKYSSEEIRRRLILYFKSHNR